MPQVHPAHLKGNEAVSILVERLSKIGVLADKITNDYGEDLVLQTHLQNTADAFSIRAQVKYVAFKKNFKGKFSYRFSIDHLRRWVAHSDPVLLCLYDKPSGKLFIVDPKKRFSIWKLASTERKTLGIHLTDADAFDDEALSALIWSMRIQYFSTMVARLESRFLYSQITRELTKRGDELVHKEIGTILFEFLNAVEILKRGKFTKNFLSSIDNSSKNLSAKYKDAKLAEAFALSLLHCVEKIAHQGLPLNLIEQSTELLGHYFRYTRPKEWQKLSRYFSTKWYPFGIKNLKQLK